MTSHLMIKLAGVALTTASLGACDALFAQPPVVEPVVAQEAMVQSLPVTQVMGSVAVTPAPTTPTPVAQDDTSEAERLAEERRQRRAERRDRRDDDDSDRDGPWG